MHLLVIILNQEDYLDEILSELIELEVANATVLDGVAMERVLAKDVPMFAGRLQSTRGSRAYNKNVFALIPKKETAHQLVEILIELEIDLSDPSVGTIFTIPVDFSLVKTS
ncbi:hypothetical protein K8I31_06380 [bacterium]|nr:hypothetical protein [bacterium]